MISLSLFIQKKKGNSITVLHFIFQKEHNSTRRPWLSANKVIKNKEPPHHLWKIHSSGFLRCLLILARHGGTIFQWLKIKLSTIPYLDLLKHVFNLNPSEDRHKGKREFNLLYISVCLLSVFTEQSQLIKVTFPELEEESGWLAMRGIALIRLWRHPCIAKGDAPENSMHVLLFWCVWLLVQKPTSHTCNVCATGLIKWRDSLILCK